MARSKVVVEKFKFFATDFFHSGPAGLIRQCSNFELRLSDARDSGAK